MCVQLAVAYFAYLRWAVTVPHGGGHSAPAGPAALPPRGPRPPVSVQALGEGSERHTLPLVAPLAKKQAERLSLVVPRELPREPDEHTGIGFQQLSAQCKRVFLCTWNARLYRR